MLIATLLLSSLTHAANPELDKFFDCSKPHFGVAVLDPQAPRVTQAGYLEMTYIPAGACGDSSSNRHRTGCTFHNDKRRSPIVRHSHILDLGEYSYAENQISPDLMMALTRVREFLIGMDQKRPQADELLASLINPNPNLKILGIQIEMDFAELMALPTTASSLDDLLPQLTLPAIMAEYNGNTLKGEDVAKMAVACNFAHEGL